MAHKRYMDEVYQIMPPYYSSPGVMTPLTYNSNILLAGCVLVQRFRQLRRENMMLMVGSVLNWDGLVTVSRGKEAQHLSLLSCFTFGHMHSISRRQYVISTVRLNHLCPWLDQLPCQGPSSPSLYSLGCEATCYLKHL